jgi:hypothetical protein
LSGGKGSKKQEVRGKKQEGRSREKIRNRLEKLTTDTLGTSTLGINWHGLKKIATKKNTKRN